MALSKEALLGCRPPERDVELAEVGTVRVRALTRAEVFEISRALPEDGSAEAWEVAVLATGVVEPELSADDVAAWRASAQSAQVQAVYDAIIEMSGTRKGAAEAAERSFPG